MGCDFFWWGKVPDPASQEAIVAFVLHAVSPEWNVPLVLTPRPGRSLMTIDRRDPAAPALHPDEYYGLIPYPTSPLEDHNQFVFDRANGGEIVTVRGHPSVESRYRKDRPCTEREQEEDVCVVRWDRGYDREVRGQRSTALLLAIVKWRYAPEMHVVDDYQNVEEVTEQVDTWRLRTTLCDRALDFEACWDIYRKTYDRHLERRRLG